MFFKEKRKTIVYEKIYNALIDSNRQEMPPQVTPRTAFADSGYLLLCFY